MTWSFVIISYGLTLLGTLALILAGLRRARRLGAEVPPAERPWT